MKPFAPSLCSLALRSLLWSSLLVATTTCIDTSAVDRNVNTVTQSFDAAIQNLSSQSVSWQNTLGNLETDLVQQGRQTLANEVQSLIARGTAAIGLEARCGADFLRARLREELQQISDRFLHRDATPPTPKLCSVDPPSVDLRRTPSERPSTLNVYGFNLSTRNLTVAVVDAGGQKTIPGRGAFNVPSEYFATFDIVGFDFRNSHRQVEFSLPDGSTQTVGITHAATCGGIDQPCCGTGAPCDHNSGCDASGRCKRCPTAQERPAPKIHNLVDTQDFDGNNLFGVNNLHRYGGPCSPGYVRRACTATPIGNFLPSTSCNREGRDGWLKPRDPHDCSCGIRFITDNNLTHGITCKIVVQEIEETPPPAPRPRGCP